MAAPIDITNQVFERLTARFYLGTKNRHRLWFCDCSCGGFAIATQNNLTRGHTKSCGCFRGRHRCNTRTTRTRAYRSWAHMMQRCTNPNFKQWKDYGGRGITVCARWDRKKGGSFENFLTDMGEPPGPEYSLDRYPDNDGPYLKENCRWATRTEQAANQRRPSHH